MFWLFDFDVKKSKSNLCMCHICCFAMCCTEKKNPYWPTALFIQHLSSFILHLCSRSALYSGDLDAAYSTASDSCSTIVNDSVSLCRASNHHHQAAGWRSHRGGREGGLWGGSVRGRGPRQMVSQPVPIGSVRYSDMHHLSWKHRPMRQRQKVWRGMN